LSARDGLAASTAKTRMNAYFFIGFLPCGP
jgi:hypothetical protein